MACTVRRPSRTELAQAPALLEVRAAKHGLTGLRLSTRADGDVVAEVAPGRTSFDAAALELELKVEELLGWSPNDHRLRGTGRASWRATCALRALTRREVGGTRGARCSRRRDAAAARLDGDGNTRLRGLLAGGDANREVCDVWIAKDACGTCTPWAGTPRVAARWLAGLTGDLADSAVPEMHGMAPTLRRWR